MNLKSIQGYLGNNGILFAVHTIPAKNITAFSNSRIERFINPSKTFSIEQSYINLAIVNAK